MHNLIGTMKGLLPLVWRVSAFTVCICASVEFIQQPKSTLSPLNGTAYFNCAVIEGTIVEWNIQIGPGKPVNWPIHRSVLRNNGFQVITWQNGSTLSVNSTGANNGTTVTCCANTQSTRVCSGNATLTIYGSPSPPQVLAVVNISKGELIIKWAAPFSFGNRIRLLYEVHATNMATGDVWESNWTESETFAYRGLWGFCALYQFAVVARNLAGSSEASQPLNTTMPTVPRVFSVETVIKLWLNATAYFSIKAQNCPEYPVEEYYINLTNALAKSSITLGPYNASKVNDTKITTDLQRNMKYIYTVTAFNTIGKNTTPPQILYTTDVQSSTITGSDHQLNVTCFFAEGTQASGCVVRLEGSGGVVYQMVPRVNETAKGVVRTEFSVDCYNISVVDWEEDGSVGSLQGVPVILNTSLNFGGQTCEGTSALLPSPTTHVRSQSATMYTQMSSMFSIPLPTSSDLNIDSDASLMAPTDHPSIVFISAGVVSGMAILAVTVVVAMVLGCHLKTRKTVISIMFSQNKEIDSKLTTPLPAPVGLDATCHSPCHQHVANINDDISMTHYDVIQSNCTMINSGGPQPYEELIRPYKVHSPGYNTVVSDYSLLNQLHTYSVLENNSRQSAIIQDSFHEYSELEGPTSSHYELEGPPSSHYELEEATSSQYELEGPTSSHYELEGATSSQYELVEDTVAYESLYESVPSAGSNV